MIETILLIIGFLLIIVGICEIIHSVCVFAAAPKKRYNSFFVIGLKKEKFMSQLALAKEQRRWMGDMFAEEIIAYYSDLSDDELSACRRYAKENNIHLVNVDYLSDIVKKLEEKVNN
jgi:hypothetical protein